MSGHHIEAIEQFAAAVSIDANLDSVWANWGVALAKLGRHTEAEAKLNKAIEINPANTSARNNLEKVQRDRTIGAQ